MYPASSTAWATQITELITSQDNLEIALVWTNAVISWPGSAAGFQLQSCPSLSSTNWILVPQTPTLTNGQFTISLPVTNNSCFFRLVK
jgi:hypothetical protein